MKESIRRIQQDGYSKPLLELVKRRRTQKQCVKFIQNDSEHTFLILVNHDGLNWNHEGIARVSSSALVEFGEEGVIEVNVDSRELLRVNGEDVSGIEHNRVLDLNDDGERWEGDVLNGKPYGWGVFYDSENRRTYEGFRIGDVNVCYGRSYCPDVGVIEYEGMIFEGKRWGRGVQYDRNGGTLFEGEWMNNEHLSKRIVLNEGNQLLSNHTEEMVVSNSICNGQEWNALDLSLMSNLRLIEVGDECFKYVKEVKLMGLKQLERVMIGKNSFTKCKDGAGNDPDRHFYLKNCEQLRELKIGHHSFSDYSVCEIENVPSLEVIEMGEVNERSYNFCYSSLELKSDSERMK